MNFLQALGILATIIAIVGLLSEVHETHGKTLTLQKEIDDLKTDIELLTREGEGQFIISDSDHEYESKDEFDGDAT